MVSKSTKEKQFMKEIYENLTQGNIKSSLKVYDKYTKKFDNSDFIDKILKSVMNKIEDDLTLEKINIAKEHVAKNVAATLAKIMLDYSKSPEQDHRN